MSRSLLRLAMLLFATAIVVGCGGAPQREIVEVQPLTPLTVEEWKAMEDLQLKHDPLSHERLKLGDPRLQNDAAWAKFERETIVPEFRKDQAPSP